MADGLGEGSGHVTHGLGEFINSLWLGVNSVSGQTRVKTFEFFTIGISVRLSDISLYREEQKKISLKIAPSRV